MPPGATRTLSLPRGLLALLAEAGVRVESLARKVGAVSASARLTPAQMDAFLDLALPAVGSDEARLKMAMDVRPELFGVVGLAAMAAPTLGVALTRVERYKRLLALDTVGLAPGRDSTRVRIHLARPDGPTARMRAEMEMVFLLAFARRMTRTQVIPQRVDLRGPVPAYQALLEAFFKAPIHHGQESDALVFSALELARPLASSNSELAGLLGPRAEQLLVESGSLDVAEQVRAALRRMLAGDEPSMEAVAQTLGTSGRTLQRRLSEAGTSFVALLGEVRWELAREQLARTDMEVAELSFLLGFSDSSAFHRAFKRWEGVTPLEYRRAARKKRPSARAGAS
ncbi:AraC family transcriptional regulator ligand-binding domain-containing protein [Archangium lansingense]|uniref:AraC family transcriptional regulator n=1 Tax=Archangium lansingense TaxID=2995310 RepID=UPI003B7665E6